MQMSDVFNLPIDGPLDEFWVQNETCVTYQDADKAAMLAINNHDKLVETLRVMLTIATRYSEAVPNSVSLDELFVARELLQELDQ